MTTDDAACCKPTSAHGTVGLHGFKCIRRTSRVITTNLPIQWTDQQPICLEKPNQRVLHNTPAFVSALHRSASSAADEAPADVGSARTTRRDPAGSPLRCSRTTCRKRRFTRLRTTAGPTALLTTKPTVVVSDAPGTTWVTRVWLTDRLPARIVERKSPLRRKRYARASTSIYAESFARPLRRRDDRIDRPARVRIRRRKPCFLLRRRLFGWKVRLLTGNSPFSVLGPACRFGSARRPPLAHV